MNRFCKKLVWYKNRLAAMSGAEILYRLGETAKRKIDRYAGARFVAAPRDCGTLPPLPGLRAGIEAWDVPAETLTQWREQAQQAMEGRPVLLNRPMTPCPRDAAWHFDLVSGTLWPRDIYCFDVPYRHPQEKGDVKFVWELNRLQYLQPIAALACKTKDAALAQFCLDSIESWIDNNPPFRGINWCSGIELTLRMISILTVATLVGEHLSRASRGKIWATLHTHARWLARYPSLYSSANNHRLCEGLGLFIIGALCPHFAEAPRWKESGWQILREAARLQILPDGASAEQTVPYTAFVAELFLTGLIVARGTGLAVPEFYTRRLALCGEYLRWLTDARGNQPRIGDDDNACVFGCYSLNDFYIASIGGCIAALAGRADLSPPGIRPHMRQALFGFPPAPDFAPQGLRQFEHSGLSVGRHISTNGEILLAFDHGYLGYLSIAAHGHADALSVWLHIDGQPVLVDAGTYMYHADEDDRRSFRSTAAHNTMQVEGVDSSLMAGNFNWSHKANALLRTVDQRGDFWMMEAEHDGYQKQFQATHRRRLSISPATGAVIEDRLIGSVTRRVQIAFLLHPNLTARQEGAEIIVSKGEKMLLRLRHESGLAARIVAADAPDHAWYSPAFAIRQPAIRIVFSGTLSAEQTAVTHLFWAV